MPAKIRKNKLEIEYSFDFELVGVRTSLKGYKLAWYLNRMLHTRLAKQKDLEVHLKKGTAAYDHYAFITPPNALHLFRNRPIDAESGAPALVPEFPHFDYVLMTQSEEKLTGNRLQEYLREVPSVELAALIPLSALKSKETFIF
ncbi:MAG: IPExxxVDY family protein [Cyclobacteriaceae bacterium]|nr:IPExxxVDY family protein [Cyclobacteriaceae bacterium]